jgi:hypothetical protein
MRDSKWPVKVGQARAYTLTSPILPQPYTTLGPAPAHHVAARST